MKETLITILFLLSSFILFAQNQVVIEGYVLDKENQEPIDQVSVELAGKGTGTLTNANGHFKIENLPPGVYNLEFSHLSYINVTRKTNAKKAGIYRVDVMMEAFVSTLEEVKIEAKSFQQQTYKAEKISRLEIRESAVRDIGDIIRRTPNLSGVRKGAIGIDPVMRGFKNKQLNVMVNGGTRIEGGCPNRMDPAVAHIEAEDISEIEILKGPYALRYGPAFGGVIHLKTVKPKPYTRYTNNITAIQGFESNWNGRKQHLSIDGGNHMVYYNISGNYKKYGNYSAGNGQEISSSFTKYNYAVQLGVSPVENQQYVFSYDRSYGRNVNFPALPMDERSDDTRLLSFDYTITKISDAWDKMRLKLYHSDVHHIMDNKERPFSDTVVAVSDITAVNYGGRLESFFNIGGQNITAGIDLENIWKNGQRTKNFILQPNLPLKIEDLWKQARIINAGFYSSWNQQLGKFDLTFSARLDFNSARSNPLILKKMNGDVLYENVNTASNYTNVSISGGLLWDIKENWGLGLTLGRGVRSPDLTERYIILLPVGYDRYDYLGNPGLKPEANHQADLKIYYENEKTGYFEANTFFSYVTNYITAQLVPESYVQKQTQDVLGVKEFYNEDRVYLYGFEFSYASPVWGKFGMTASGAVTIGINPDATKYIIESGQVTGEEKIGRDALPEIPPFESNIDFIYKIIENKLQTKASVRMVAAQEHVSDAFYEEATPGFVLADLSVNYMYSKNLRVNAGVNNIFDKAYYEHLNRRIIGSMQPLYEPGRLFFVNLILNI
ncbi:MAG: TonB-dependent receptor [Bacteroidales bacterium]|nr:TonB-dependent receptor [Bacteroidales bacterium]MCF8386769.1 TonB-dependent receptor [Bacteroidales bacterium]MCF8398962.1 TonB-dependent receptor [Bacteroidales bacterium]